MLPVGITQHDHAGRAAIFSVAGKDEAAEGRLHLENREIIAGHPAHRHLIGTTVDAQRDERQPLADDLAKRLRLFAEFRELRIRKAQRPERRTLLTDRQDGKLLGRRDRHGAYETPIHQAENRGVCTDPETPG